MPIFQVDVEKRLGTEYWTNVYHVDAVDMAAAQLDAGTITEIERDIHPATVSFTKTRVSLAGEEDPSQFSIIPTGGVGNVTGIGPTEQLPLFCAVRVDFMAGFGRPARKYLRGCLAETNVDGSTLTSTFLTFVDNNYVDPLIAMGNYVKLPDEPITLGTVMQAIAMRQLRRGSKRAAILGP